MWLKVKQPGFWSSFPIPRSHLENSFFWSTSLGNSFFLRSTSLGIPSFSDVYAASLRFHFPNDPPGHRPVPLPMAGRSRQPQPFGSRQAQRALAPSVMCKIARSQKFVRRRVARLARGAPSMSILNPGILPSFQETSKKTQGETAGFLKERWLKKNGESSLERLQNATPKKGHLMETHGAQ